ncbi:DUF3696 domain-containing protein [bacterium]|nr:DUF3696 domain-containing protein [bacterium]
MRLSHIEIENFKGISTKQSIDLAPITLLFGPNSAGKSTILQALQYVREILERKNLDPDQTIAGGLTDLGGFAALVHDHDLTRPICIKIRIDMKGDQGNERLPLNSGESLTDPNFHNLGIRYLVGENTELKVDAIVQEIGLSLEVRWSDLINAPYVARVAVEMDRERIAEIHSPSQEGRAQLTSFNFAHPCLQEIPEQEEDVDQDDTEVLQVTDQFYREIIEDPFSSPLGAQIWELSREMSAISSTKSSDEDTGEFRIGVETELGALPDPAKPLTLDLIDLDLQLLAWSEADQEGKRRRGLSSLIDELVLGPVRVVSDYLRAMTYIGPLREIPSRDYKPRLSPDETRWAQGLAAWDLLYTQPDDSLLENVNNWMVTEERLKTGYQLEKLQLKQVPITSAFHQFFQRGIQEDDLGDLQELYTKFLTTTEIALLDINKNITVSPSDIGVGISQMLPVVVACLMQPKGLVAVEQPELHIHPAIQVGLGDLFIEATQGMQPAIGADRTLLVETHSEHIMLRLLRRIREKNDDSLPPDIIGLSPSDVSVVYVEARESGTEFQALRVDETGEFLDRWPKGFFRERAKELF